MALLLLMLFSPGCDRRGGSGGGGDDDDSASMDDDDSGSGDDDDALGDDDDSALGDDDDSAWESLEGSWAGTTQGTLTLGINPTTYPCAGSVAVEVNGESPGSATVGGDYTCLFPDANGTEIACEESFEDARFTADEPVAVECLGATGTIRFERQGPDRMLGIIAADSAWLDVRFAFHLSR